MSSVALASKRLVLADLFPGTLVRDIVLVIVGAGLTGLAAQVSVHTSLSPVPFTLQTVAVLMTGAALGTVRGLASMLLYLVAGTAGVPWFANHAHGWGGPSLGYLLGFVAAAGIVGALAKRGADRHVISTALLMLLGNVALYAIGVTWLYAYRPVATWSFGDAIHYGMTVFLISDGIKIAIAALALPATWKLVHR